MPSTNQPLQLKELVFPVLMVRANFIKAADTARAIDLGDLDVRFEFKVDDEDQSIGVANLSIKSKDTAEVEKVLRYEFDIQAFAVFELNKSVAVDEKLSFVRRFNAATTVVGAAREQLAQLTARGPWGVALMPNIPIQSLAGKYPESPKSAVTSEKNEAAKEKNNAAK